MKKILIRAVLCVLAFTVFVQADESEEIASIKKRQQEFTDAWNKHDAKALASFWVEEGDVINPWGVYAKGVADIEKFFAKEQATAMKNSTYKGAVTNVLFPRPDVAVVNVEAEIVGVVSPEGIEIPPFKHHITWLLIKKEGQWFTVAARPVRYPNTPQTSAVMEKKEPENDKDSNGLMDSFLKARQLSRGRATLNNARMLDAAIDQWALENGKTEGNAVDLKAIAIFLKEGIAIRKSLEEGNVPLDVLGNPFIINKTGATQIQINPKTKQALPAMTDWGNY